MAILLRERPNNPAGFVGGGDAVHPGPIGHTVMAWAVLKGLGASALVSSVELDSTTQKAGTKGCRVQNVRIAGDVISFDRLDDALPMPIDERAEPALKLAPILEELSRYELLVSGLKGANYKLTIDGEEAGQFSGEELGKGCNLSARGGPITFQARKVLALVSKKNEFFFNRWRNVQLFSFPDWAQSPTTLSRSTRAQRGGCPCCSHRSLAVHGRRAPTQGRRNGPRHSHSQTLRTI